MAGSRIHGFETLEEIDTSYTPSFSGDRVWIQRSRSVIRSCGAWALVAFICDHRWPAKAKSPTGSGYRWERMVSLRRYRRAHGRWRETSYLNVRASDFPSIMDTLKAVADIDVGDPSLEEQVQAALEAG